MPNLTFLAPTVPEIWRGSQYFKSRSRNPFPTCKWRVAGDPIFGFPDPDLPIHYTSFIGLRWRLRVIYRRPSPLLRSFSRFLAQNLAGSRDLWIGGRRWPHIWIPWPRLAYSLYNFYYATMTIKNSLHGSIPIVKAFLTQIFLSPVKNWRKISVFWGKWGLSVKLCFKVPPKGTSLRETTSFDVLIVKIGEGVLAAGWRSTKKTSRVTWCAFSHIWGRRG